MILDITRGVSAFAEAEKHLTEPGSRVRGNASDGVMPPLGLGRQAGISRVENRTGSVARGNS